MKQLIFLMIFLLSSSLFAARGGSGGGWAIGGNFHLVTPNQSDLNTLISRSNSRAGGISTPQMGNAWEFSGYIHYRFDSSIIAFQFRPSYFMQSTSGSASNGDSYKYALSGFSLMPLLRWYLLESDAIKFFLNTGIGYGFLNGEIKEASFSTEFSGNNTGYMGGMGVEFCYDNHCCNIEGNIRYMFFERNISKSMNGSLPSPNPGLSQASSGTEIEIDNRDLGTTMSGVQGTIGYMYYF